jgi:hypothetical protein
MSLSRRDRAPILAPAVQVTSKILITLLKPRHKASLFTIVF